MVLVPVQNARQGHFRPELLQRNLHPHRPEPDPLSSITDTQHRHPFARNECLLAEILDRIAPPVVFRYHTEARRTAISGFELVIMGEKVYHTFFI